MVPPRLITDLNLHTLFGESPRYLSPRRESCSLQHPIICPSQHRNSDGSIYPEDLQSSSNQHGCTSPSVPLIYSSKPHQWSQGSLRWPFTSPYRSSIHRAEALRLSLSGILSRPLYVSGRLCPDSNPNDLLSDGRFYIRAYTASCYQIHRLSQKLLQEKGKLHKMIKTRLLKLHKDIYITGFVLLTPCSWAE